MDIKELEGITTRQVNLLKKYGYPTIESLVFHIPYRYYDYRQPAELTPMIDMTDVAVEGIVWDVVTNNKDVKDPKFSFRLKVQDTITRNYLYATWFRNPKLYYFFRSNVIGKRILVCGKVQCGQSREGRFFFNMIPHHYAIDVKEIESYKRMIPVYSKHKNISEQALLSFVSQSEKLAEKEIKEMDLPVSLLQKYRLLTNENMIRFLHHPDSPEQIKYARQRMLFNDMFYFASELIGKEYEYPKNAAVFISKDTFRERLLQMLPFELTEDQKTAVIRMAEKMHKGQRLNDMVIGDVGCGKTIVAILLMLLAAENKYQAVLMAPTTILAKQHYEELSGYAERFGLKTAFLGGKQTAKEQKSIIKGIEEGEYQLIVGTHAVTSDKVQFNNLGICVVDEEHKFGVEQREKISQKANLGIHVVTMSATPIPRSIAQTIISDYMTVHNIKSKPNGRLPIITQIVTEEADVFKKMDDCLQKGNQAYVVCPMIDEADEDSHCRDLASVEKIAESYQMIFEPKGYKVCVVTGKTDSVQAESCIEAFLKNEYQILVSTTVIEVGVNVPNTTLIVINNAERFGLAGLHQLRGRVGRNSLQSYCLLNTADIQNPRLQAMCQTNDGFEIAEIDFNLRGSGDIIGTIQAGKNKYMEQIMDNPPLFKKIKEIAQQIHTFDFTKKFLEWYKRFQC